MNCVKLAVTKIKRKIYRSKRNETNFNLLDV